MGQEALPPSPAAVAFSWEHEQGVPKPVSAPAVGAPDMPESPRKVPTTMVLSWEHETGMPKPAVKPSGGVPESARKAHAPTRRLSVPPPPGQPAARSISRAVRPADDPFLAAYLACTKSTDGRGDGGKRRTTGAREPKKDRRRFAWAGLGLSCKRDGGVVAQSMVRMAKLPELDTRDA